jgi:hypothetical protein
MIVQCIQLLNGWWAQISEPGPCSFWDDFTQLKEILPKYHKLFDFGEWLLGDKVSSTIITSHYSFNF